MFHLAAFSASVANGTTNTDVAALSDDILTIQNSHFLLPQDMWLAQVVGMGVGINRHRITSPTLRQITQPQVRPVISGATPPTNPNVMFLHKRPIRVRGGEELAYQATHDDAGAQIQVGLIWLMDRADPLPQGDPVTLRGTSTTAATANAWSSITYTLDDQLPAGVYALVSSEVISTNAKAHRWIIDNQFWRPGYLSNTALGNRSPDRQLEGDLGLMGNFRNTSLPRLQVLAGAADASHTVFMRVIRVGP